MAFVDGVVIPVPEAKRAEYVSRSAELAELFLSCGALEVVDAWSADVPEGEVTSFPLAVKRGPDEAVVFSWILWPSREARDDGWAKAMTDERITSYSAELFDGKRMIYGGFDVVQSTRKGD